jgi:putative tryptophan/tyrosine transport system substrate-binding protein
MRRRDFLLGLGGGIAAAWTRPLAAEQSGLPVVGFLDSGTPDGMEANLAGFYTGLSENGYADGKNVIIEYRWAAHRPDQLPNLAAELVRRGVAVIAATRSPAPALAAKAATSTIPVVFQTGGDPVLDGLVVSLNRPGGNLTGATRMTTNVIPKRLGLIAELKPKMTEIAALMNPIGAQVAGQRLELEAATRARGLNLRIFEAHAEQELEPAFAAVRQSKADALVVVTSPLFQDIRERIASLALRDNVPTIFGERNGVLAGGLMSYAASLEDSFRQVGDYVGRILKGEKPADLPVQQPTKFEFVINLKTAKTLGLTVPPGVLAIADEVIE